MGQRNGIVTYRLTPPLATGVLNDFATAADGSIRLWYIGTKLPMSPQSRDEETVVVERVQTGVRLEKRMLKVLKALADSLDITLGDLLEGIVLHALEGKAPFSKPTRAKVAELRKVFGLTLTAADAHHPKEKPNVRAPRPLR